MGAHAMNSLAVSVCLLIVAVAAKGKLLENRITRFFSNISLEIYLSHMVLFRVVERLGLNTVFGSSWLQYTLTVLFVLILTVFFSLGIKKAIKEIEKRTSAALVNIEK